MITTIGTVYRRMSHAAMHAGRDPQAVQLVAVSKTVGDEAVREAYDAGLRIFGESRVQEAVAKAEELCDLNITWHMVGHLQKNKAKLAVGLFDLIHSVDSPELLQLIEKHADEIGKVQRVLLQVKLSDEAAKSGTDEAGLEELLRAAQGCYHVSIEGLMTVPPLFDDPEQVRPYFKRLYQINERYGFRELSMGMTSDFEVAIEEGSTMVRVGTAIFGEREYTK